MDAASSRQASIRPAPKVVERHWLARFAGRFVLGNQGLGGGGSRLNAEQTGAAVLNCIVAHLSLPAVLVVAWSQLMPSQIHWGRFSMRSCDNAVGDSAHSAVNI
ncbi:hypothetical protein D3C84_867610 [compost metagenome]